jgi:hypothetical protein
MLKTIKLENDPFYMCVVQKRPFSLPKFVKVAEELYKNGLGLSKSDFYDNVNEIMVLTLELGDISVEGYLMAKKNNTLDDPSYGTSKKSITDILTEYNQSLTQARTTGKAKGNKKGGDKIRNVWTFLNKNPIVVSTMKRIFDLIITTDPLKFLKLDMLAHGVFLEDIDEPFFQGTRNVYMVHLPTYIWLHADDYYTPEYLKKTFAQVFFSSLRVNTKALVNGDVEIKALFPADEMFENSTKRMQQELEILKAFENRMPVSSETPITTAGGLDEESFKQMIMTKYGDFFPDWKYDSRIYATWANDSNPTGITILTTRQATRATLEGENALWLIVASIAGAARDGGGIRLPQRTPKMIQMDNNAIMQKIGTTTWSNTNDSPTVRALYFVPIPMVKMQADLQNSFRQDIISKKSDPVPSGLVVAQQCIMNEKCSNAEWQKQLGNIIHSNAVEEKESKKAKAVLENMCSAIRDRSSYEHLRVQLRLEEIANETDEMLCARVQAQILKNYEAERKKKVNKGIEQA